MEFSHTYKDSELFFFFNISLDGKKLLISNFHLTFFLTVIFGLVFYFRMCKQKHKQMILLELLYLKLGKLILKQNIYTTIFMSTFWVFIFLTSTQFLHTTATWDYNARMHISQVYKNLIMSIFIHTHQSIKAPGILMVE